MKTIKFSDPIWKSSYIMLVKATYGGFPVNTIAVDLSAREDMMFYLRCLLLSHFPGQDLEVYHIGAQELYNMYFRG